MQIIQSRRRFGLSFVWYLAFVSVCAIYLLITVGQAQAAEFATVEVSDPYIELHTGPGRGYPIFHVATRHELVEILKRKTDWFKVRTGKGKEGWVYLAQMDNTFTAPAVKAQFGHLAFKNYDGQF